MVLEILLFTQLLKTRVEELSKRIEHDCIMAKAYHREHGSL